MKKIFKTNTNQEKFFDNLAADTKNMSNGQRKYYERFDINLFDRKPFMREYFDRLFESVIDTRGVLLDIGCGTGFYFECLIKYCAHIIGVDISGGMIKKASELIEKKGILDISAVTYDGIKLPVEAGSIDTVLCLDSMHHVINPKNIVNEIDRVLKPQGKLIIIDPNMYNPLMFAVHLIPAEERTALRRNYVHIMKRLFKPRFVCKKIEYANCVVSSGKILHAFIQLAGGVLRKTPVLKHMSLRFIMHFEKSKMS